VATPQWMKEMFHMTWKKEEKYLVCVKKLTLSKKKVYQNIIIKKWCSFNLFWVVFSMKKTRGFELSVCWMLLGEMALEALITCSLDYAYGMLSRPLNVPEGVHIQGEIELLSFKTQKNRMRLDFEIMGNEVESMRNMDDKLFKQGKYKLAKAK